MLFLRWRTQFFYFVISGRCGAGRGSDVMTHRPAAASRMPPFDLVLFYPCARACVHGAIGGRRYSTQNGSAQTSRMTETGPTKGTEQGTVT